MRDFSASERIQASGQVPVQRDTVADRFEAAWQSGHSPEIEDFLTSDDVPSQGSRRREIILQLLEIDLEHRWRKAHAHPDFGDFCSQDLPQRCTEETLDGSNVAVLPRTPLLEDYVRRFPELQPWDKLPAPAIAVEFRARHLWGDRPAPDDYLRRFPSRSVEVQALLADIALQLPDRPELQKMLGGFPPQQEDVTLTYCVLQPAGSAETRGHVAPFLSADAHQSLADVFRIESLLQDRYHLERELGRGGMGQVYLGHDRRLDRLVAIKVSLLVGEGNRTPGAEELVHRQQNFLEEARLGAKLNHSAIATVYDYGFCEGAPFAVFEYLPGQMLRSRLQRTGTLTLDDIRLIVAFLAPGLDFAHDHHVVHRDLKPENIRADDRGNFKILDLGLARVFRGRHDWSGFAGTPAYAAPEQAAGLACDGRTDQYALALIVYEMLTGSRLFQARSPLEILEMHRTQEPQIPEAIAPAAIRSALLKALSKNPQDRFVSCQAFAAALGCRFVQSLSLPKSPRLETIALRTYANLCLKIPGCPLPQPHPLTPLAAVSPGVFWYALLVLDSQSLWLNYRGQTYRYPLTNITRVRTIRCGYVLQIFASDQHGQTEKTSLYFASRNQASQWSNLLSTATTGAVKECEVQSELRVEFVPMLTAHPTERLQILGIVEASHPKRWIARALLQVQASRLGADAIVGLQEEQLPGLNATTRRLSGLGVQAVDQDSLSALMLRWFLVESTETLKMALAFAVMIFLYLLMPSPGVWREQLQHFPTHLIECLLLTILLEGSPIFVLLLLRLTRWPQFSILAGILLTLTALPHAFVVPVAIVLLNPIPLALFGLKLYLARRVFSCYRQLKSVLPESSRRGSLPRTCTVILTGVLVSAAYLWIVWTAMSLLLQPDPASGSARNVPLSLSNTRVIGPPCDKGERFNLPERLLGGCGQIGPVPTSTIEIAYVGSTRVSPNLRKPYPIHAPSSSQITIFTTCMLQLPSVAKPLLPHSNRSGEFQSNGLPTCCRPRDRPFS